MMRSVRGKYKARFRSPPHSAHRERKHYRVREVDRQTRPVAYARANLDGSDLNFTEEYAPVAAQVAESANHLSETTATVIEQELAPTGCQFNGLKHFTTD
ncbi:MAG: hypothetical protein RBS80_00685 [Thermoguttaceae bacterium]|jgi:hypothetical protein|nr:hypothetical protein [Thermoguttaceae bacterium]